MAYPVVYRLFRRRVDREHMNIFPPQGNRVLEHCKTAIQTTSTDHSRSGCRFEAVGLASSMEVPVHGKRRHPRTLITMCYLCDRRRVFDIDST